MPLSDAAIRRLKPREKQYKVSDFDGLFVLVRPNGARLWQFKYRIAGKEKLLSIGPYPETSLAQARAMRDAARSMVARGIDPSEAKQEQKRQNLLQDRLTFAVQAREYLAKIRQEGRAEMTMRKLEWLLAMAIEDLGDRPIADITAPDVLRCLRKVEARGTHETARRLRSTIGTVFRFAVASGLLFPLKPTLTAETYLVLQSTSLHRGERRCPSLTFPRPDSSGFPPFLLRMARSPFRNRLGGRECARGSFPSP